MTVAPLEDSCRREVQINCVGFEVKMEDEREHGKLVRPQQVTV